MSFLECIKLLFSSEKELGDGTEKKVAFDVQQITIEGCEYFKVRNMYSYYTLCHKGNCKNKIHYRPPKKVAK